MKPYKNLIQANLSVAGVYFFDFFGIVQELVDVVVKMISVFAIALEFISNWFHLTSSNKQNFFYCALIKCVYQSDPFEDCLMNIHWRFA